MKDKGKRPFDWPLVLILLFPASIPYYIGKEAAIRFGASNVVATLVGMFLFVVACAGLGIVVAKLFPGDKNSS